jgi:hypothetical protein
MRDEKAFARILVWEVEASVSLQESRKSFAAARTCTTEKLLGSIRHFFYK